jgi:predicted amidophosphoribosyltransferase
MNAIQFAADAVRSALAIAFPVSCAGCGAPDHAVCPVCRAQLAPAPSRFERPGVTGRAALRYGGVVRSVIASYKEQGRTDVAAALGPALRAAVRAALAGPAAETASCVLLVPIPPSRAALRARGYDPVSRLLASAGFRGTRGLAHVGVRADQAGLGRNERAWNLAGTLAGRPSAVAGRSIIIVDDIVTTGATLYEAGRAVRAAGGTVIGFATLAETLRRFPDPRS